MTDIDKLKEVLADGYMIGYRELLLRPAYRVLADKREDAELKERIERHEGLWVIYDPKDDACGWMLVGDDLAAMIAETYDSRVLN